MLDFTNSSDHGALIEEDNKLEGVVGCFVASLQRHISSSWKLYVQVFFIESIMDLSMLKSLRSCTMGLLLWNF
jgi:hypothetical protein